MYPSSAEYKQLPMSALQSPKRPVSSAWAQAWTEGSAAALAAMCMPKGLLLLLLLPPSASSLLQPQHTN